MKLDKDILRQKVVRAALAALLLLALILVWNWDTSSEEVVNTPVTNNGVTQQTPEPTTAEPEVEPTPEPEPVPAEPFSISLPAGTTGPSIVQEGGVDVYKYQFADGALMNIYPDGNPAAVSTDITWQYTAVNGTAGVVEKVDSLCQAGTPGCTAGNGQIEIYAQPAASSSETLEIKIVDPNASTKTIAAAATFYENVVNSVRIN